MDRVPNSVPVRLKAKAAGDHPDLELLAALAEQALPERERAQVLLHLSRCSDCREVLALATPPVEAASPSLDTARRPWFRWPVLRWAAAVACLVIVGSAVLMKRETMEFRSMSTAMVESDAKSASLRDERAAEPAPPTESVHPQSLATSAPEAKATTPARDKDSRRSSAIHGAVVPRYPQGGAAGMAGKSGAAAVGGMGAMGGGFLKQYPAAPAPLTPLERTNEEFLANSAPAQKEGPRDLPRNVIAPITVPPNSAQEKIQVAAAAPVAVSAEPADSDQLKREAPGKAKAPATKMTLDRMETTGDTLQATEQEETTANTARAKKSDRYRASSSNSPVSRWTISSDGKLQHSIDSGKTWQQVPVAENAVFRALSANGPDLWVGGSSGLLYHSSDAGSHWTQIKPVSGDSTLAADVAAIEFTDTRQGKVTTASGEIWTTTDGGQSWLKQP